MSEVCVAKVTIKPGRAALQAVGRPIKCRWKRLTWILLSSVLLKLGRPLPLPRVLL